MAGPMGPAVWFRDGALGPQGLSRVQAFIFFAASVIAGTIWNMSPTIP